MRLEDDVDKFFDLVVSRGTSHPRSSDRYRVHVSHTQTLIRHTAARYVDMHVPYKMQDTNIIKKIEAEV